MLSLVLDFKVEGKFSIEAYFVTFQFLWINSCFSTQCWSLTEQIIPQRWANDDASIGVAQIFELNEVSPNQCTEKQVNFACHKNELEMMKNIIKSSH